MKYTTRQKAILLLSDGTIFHGKSMGIEGTTFGEVCFNTGMTGYQEIFTDPSYFGQIMVATNSHIGNYGVNDNEVDSNSIKIAGLVCKNFSFNYSRVDASGSLEDYFIKENLICISDVDTRALVSYIRDNGAMNSVICTDGTPVEDLKEALAKCPDMKGLELASKVSTTSPYFWGDENAKYKISALDLGIKYNILRNLAQRGCYVKVFITPLSRIWLNLIPTDISFPTVLEIHSLYWVLRKLRKQFWKRTNHCLESVWDTK
jgi:carbamoyl-phosphate synthase small subunit